MNGPKKWFVVTVFMVMLFGCQSNKNKKPSYSPHEVQEALLAYNKRLSQNIYAEIDTFIKYSPLHFKEDAEGYYYVVLKKGNNIFAKEDNHVSCKLIFKLLDGTVCYPEKVTELTHFIVGKHMLPIVNSSIKHIDVGGEIEVVVSPYLAYGLNGDGKNIPPARPYLLHIALLKVNNDSLK